MGILIDEAFLPATLTMSPMSDSEFAEFCSEHPDLTFETTAEGELIVMPPAFSLTGMRNQQIAEQFLAWARRDARGITGDSSTGFVLPSGARRSPDLAWVPRADLEKLPPEQLETYWHLCPRFVIELRSRTDRLKTLREKMNEWIANGAELAWLIDPESRSVEIYRPGREPELLTGIETVEAADPVPGFILHLQRVWDPMNTGPS